MKDIIIIGAGGVGREVVWIIDQINMKSPTWNIIGFVDDNQMIWNSEINGYPVIGGLEYLEKIKTRPEIIVAIANYNVKKNIVKNLNGKFKYATIIHPDVYIDFSNKIGEGSIIYPGVFVTTNVTVGNHVIISPKCGVGHDSIIKDYVALLWNVNISGFNTIEEGVLIGSGATIIQQRKIGREAIVGAGAVVIKDVRRNTTNVGVPANEID